MSVCPTAAIGVDYSFPLTSSTGIPPPRKSISLRNDQSLRLLETCKDKNKFRVVHAQIIKSGRHHDPLVLSKVLRFCAGSEWMDYASKIFENIDNRDVYHYTAMICGNISIGCHYNAIQLYFRMVAESIRPDAFVVSYGLRACSFLLTLEEGRQIHGQVLKLNIGCERHVRMRLMESYAKCGDYEAARKVFSEMPERDVVASTILITSYAKRGFVEESLAIFERVRVRDIVCWTATIDGLVQNGRMNEALELFRRMQTENVVPNEVTIVCVLSACSQLGALDLGKWVHSYLDKYNINSNTHVGSALIDMYSRCGSLDEAQAVFEEMTVKDVVCYNSMIAGFALHGRCSEAVKLFEEMVRQGIMPNSVTFVGVLNACSHGGMVNKAFGIFDNMTMTYGINPRIEHYGCMVDLLGRVGLLTDAYYFIKKMKIEPDQILWGALLSACKSHGNLALAEEVAGILINNKFADSGTYILISNVYASFGKWDDAARMRAQMKKSGIQKEPGCSSIEVDNEIHEFLLGDIRHPRREEIYKKLDCLNERMKIEGYTPAKDAVLQDIEEGEKEWALAIHSERLAICFGLISTKAGSTIRIFKNLRVCNDCHSMIKIIAKVTGRKLIVRDRNRFHHFENGLCSCGDYW